MKIFVAGASGAIGIPLLLKLLEQGHTVTGMTQSAATADKLRRFGVNAEVANALDAEQVLAAMRRVQPEIVIDELTALPRDPANMAAAQAGDTALRLTGGANLQAAAQACGVRRILQQASGFFLVADSGLATEAASLVTDASPGIARSAQTYTAIERRTLDSPVEGIVLRYGFFYGPNTWYHPEGGAADQVRRQEFPIVGQGGAVWSWVHVEDAAQATVAALTADPGVYNVVDDDPSPVNIWLPAFARSLGALPPPRRTELEVRESAGEDAVFYGTRLCGASNRKAKRDLGFAPRRLEWLSA